MKAATFVNSAAEELRCRRNIAFTALDKQSHLKLLAQELVQSA